MSGRCAGHGMRACSAAAAAGLAIVFAPTALAQLAKAALMSSQEAKAALFGIDMQGYEMALDEKGAPTGKSMNWRECINPKGETLYETPGRTVHGRLKITDGAQACFAYEESGFKQWNCFQAMKTTTGFRFTSNFGDVFVTTLVRTGVKSCKPRSDLIG